MNRGAWQVTVHGVTKSWTRLSDFTFTFHFHALEKEMATHSSVLAWRIPGKGEPGGLPSMGLHRVGHDLSDLAAVAAGLPVHHELPEFTQTHVHRVGDAIQPSGWHLSSPSPPAPNSSQHQGVFQESTLHDPINYSPSGSSVQGILQARILERVAIPFSRGSS